jgi:hypothetical protein
MAVFNTRRYFLDTLVETLGIKSGLGITVPEALDLLRRDQPGWNWWDGDRDERVRVRPEEFEDVYIHLLHATGGIADTRGSMEVVFEYCRRHDIRVPDDSSYRNMQPPIAAAVAYVEGALIAHLEDEEALPDQLSALPDFHDFLFQYAVREILADNLPEGRGWDGVVSLRDLFDSEAAPSMPETYFDQRYIDYLNAQPGDLTKMHWRQFEYLTGEFFHRSGYRVTIGPGRADGGIDVRAEKDRIFAGPEVIIIQCRRKGDQYEVQIDEVKALWADVLDEGAAYGVMATTTRLARGAREYCAARHYRVRGAERELVRKWLREMTSHGEAWQPAPSQE